MHELIDEQTANVVVNVLAVALPAVGLAAGALWGAVHGRPALGAGRGLAVGCIGVANWLLWRLYSGVTNRLGLDTVKNLLVNLALFLAIGAMVGIAAGLWRRMKI